MDAAVAETIVRASRDQAENDARADLNYLKDRALQAGMERSRKITKVTTINTSTGVARHNPSGRLLRDWYMHVYLNTVRGNLGQPAVTIDAQQVEDLTGILHRIRPATPGERALQAVAVMRDVAVDDAAHAALEIVSRLRQVGVDRAVRHVGDDRFDSDPVRIHVTRHWYQRCYDAHVESATHSQQPRTEVTNGEQRQVAIALETRQVRRLIGLDNVPLVTAHNTRLTELDRRLSAGDVWLISPATESAHHTDSFQNLRVRVTRTWRDLDLGERTSWLQMAGAEAQAAPVGWASLSGDTQSKIIRLYLQTHRPELLDEQFNDPVIAGSPEVAAQQMFNHRSMLTSASAPRADTAVAADRDALPREPDRLAILDHDSIQQPGRGVARG